MNCYLVEGCVVIRYFISERSASVKLSNLVMADNENEAEYKFIKYYEARSTPEEDYKVDWCVVNPTIV